MRAKKEQALTDGKTTEAETPVKPKRGNERPHLEQWRTRERMMELVKIRQEKIARGELGLPEGKARQKFTKAEKEQAALDKLMPKALKVLEEQLDDKDPRVRQAAAIKVIEYRKGKPTQMIKQDISQVTAIRFETAAVGGMMLPPPADLPLLESGVIDGEAVEDGDDETA
jgi:hypothetical protein